MKTKKELKEEVFALDVTNLPDHVENTGEIIADIIAGASTLKDLVPMTGAKANTQVQLNILNTDVTWSGADCVSAETGDNTTLNPRYVDISRITDREDLCLDKLDAKLPMIQAAGARNEDLPCASLFIDMKVNKNGKEVEKLAWRGDTTVSGNMALADGWLKIASTETSDLAYYEADVIFNAGTAIEVIREKILANRTNDMFESDDLVIYMELSKYSILADAIVNAYGIAGTGMFTNVGHENQLGLNEMIFPGTTVLVKGVAGMSGSDAIFATSTANLRYATDLENDMENVELYFDKYHKALVSDIVFAIGFQYEYPEKVIMLDLV